MKKSFWLLVPGFLLAGCLMSRLEVKDDNGSSAAGTSSAGTSAGSDTTGIGGDGGPDQGGSSSSGGSSAGTGATTMAGGSGAEGGEPPGGSASGGTAGADTSGGTAGSGGTGGGSGGTAGGGGQAGSGGSAGSINDVWKSDGCSKAYTGATGTTAITLDTQGQKDANCADKLNSAPLCGLWGQAGSTWRTTPVPRDYYVNLPTGYDQSKAYPLVIMGPGCSGNGTQVYPLPDLTSSAIRVGWTPPPNYVGHGTNPNQGCFDDKEGDDSVDVVFFNDMYDKLNAELCFDRNRVFIGGDSSGGTTGNELACKYAGDPDRPVRGVLANDAQLPNVAPYAPTCSDAPTTGIWVHEVGDPTIPFAGDKVAIDRAMAVNGCTLGTSYDTAQFDDYPIGGGNADSVCQKIKGCPADYPLVVCALPGNGHSTHSNVTNPAFATFVTSLMAK